MSGLRYGTGLGKETMQEVGPYARQAEELGFEQITFLDDINLTRDVYAMLAVAAMATETVQVGTGVTHPYVRHPVQTAVAIASIDELAGGRAFLGMGAGALHSLLGMRNATLADLRRALEVTRSLLSGEPAELPDGTVVECPWVRGPSPPIHLASDGPGTMQLAAELADATWIVGLQDTLVDWRLQTIDRGLELAGRSRADFGVWLRCGVVIADSKQEARDRARVQAATHAHQFIIAILNRDTPATREIKARLPAALLDDYARLWAAWDYRQHDMVGAGHAAAVSDALVDAYVVTGTPEDCAATLSQVAAKGYDGVSITVSTEADKPAFWRLFMDEVVPRVRA